MIRRPPISTRADTLFPDTTLFRSLALSACLEVGTDGRRSDLGLERATGILDAVDQDGVGVQVRCGSHGWDCVPSWPRLSCRVGIIASTGRLGVAGTDPGRDPTWCQRDRKSTRLNSSH